MNIKELIVDINQIDLNFCDNDKQITGISCNSKEVKNGFLFAALKGTQTNGVKFIDSAIENGAIAILCDNDEEIKEVKNITYLRTDNPRKILSLISSKYYQNQPKFISAVTGTNGKTSIAHFTRQLWYLMGKKSASIGTTGVDLSGGGTLETNGKILTTPDHIQIHKILNDLFMQEYQYVLLEASSHGLEQNRLDGVEIQVAAFTNLSQDHLDYHETFENYFKAKMRLFNNVLPKNKVAVINSDDKYSDRVIEIAEKRNQKIITIGFKGKTIKFSNIEASNKGQILKFSYENKEFVLRTNLHGKFQIYNLMMSAAIVYSYGFDLIKIVKLIEDIQPVDGRMQKIHYEGCDLQVFVDYAHTPDALEKVIKTVKEIKGGKLWVVFGCGGDRDKDKRPLMGEIASKLADKVVITDDNPRNENPCDIRKQIFDVCNVNAINIENRFKAIEYAIKNANNNDKIIIAGKGHEKTQIIGNKIIDFDDAKIAYNVMEENFK